MPESEFYTTFVRKMPEFYIMFARKNIFRDFLGCSGEGNPLAFYAYGWAPGPPPAKSGSGDLSITSPTP